VLNNLEILVEVILVKIPTLETKYYNTSRRVIILASFKVWRKNVGKTHFFFEAALWSIDGKNASHSDYCLALTKPSNLLLRG